MRSSLGSGVCCFGCLENILCIVLIIQVVAGLVAADFFHHEVGVRQAHTVLTQRFVGSAILEVIVE